MDLKPQLEGRVTVPWYIDLVRARIFPITVIRRTVALLSNTSHGCAYSLCEPTEIS
jgi:hypothetical protein